MMANYLLMDKWPFKILYSKIGNIFYMATSRNLFYYGDKELNY